MDMDKKKKILCAQSAAYSVRELHLNTMYHAAKKRGRGVAGGVKGVSMVIVAWGEGVM
jgi:hypothetical protein